MTNFFKKLAGIDNHRHSGTGKKNIDDESININKETGNELIEQTGEEEWLSDSYEEGQLSVDVYQTPSNLIVVSTIAGVKPEDIDISLNNDMLTIRGKREMKRTVSDEDYLYKECYWGNFSRSIILPVEIRPEQIQASLESGVLTIVLPKAKSAKQISIKVREK